MTIKSMTRDRRAMEVYCKKEEERKVYQKSARMSVCTSSESSTMAGHSPEPIAFRRKESPSMICRAATRSEHFLPTHCFHACQAHTNTTSAVGVYYIQS